MNQPIRGTEASPAPRKEDTEARNHFSMDGTNETA
jgi:hypothetical protein